MPSTSQKSAKEDWIRRWELGEIGFHRDYVSPELVNYLLKRPWQDKKILLPLCGRSEDLTFLTDQGFEVHGVEMANKPIDELIRQQGLNHKEFSISPLKLHWCGKLYLWEGDFFHFNSPFRFDFIFDRAAMVALNPLLRAKYPQKIKELLKPEGIYLLVTYDELDSEDGPPFLIPYQELEEFFPEFSIVKVGERKTDLGNHAISWELTWKKS